MTPWHQEIPDALHGTCWPAQKITSFLGCSSPAQLFPSCSQSYPRQYDLHVKAYTFCFSLVQRGCLLEWCPEYHLSWCWAHIGRKGQEHKDRRNLKLCQGLDLPLLTCTGEYVICNTYLRGGQKLLSFPCLPLELEQQRLGMRNMYTMPIRGSPKGTKTSAPSSC